MFDRILEDVTLKDIEEQDSVDDDDFRIEYQLAKYLPVSRGYVRHLDYESRTDGKSESARYLSLVLYLNDQWKEQDGGKGVRAPKGSRRGGHDIPQQSRVAGGWSMTYVLQILCFVCTRKQPDPFASRPATH